MPPSQAEIEAIVVQLALWQGFLFVFLGIAAQFVVRMAALEDGAQKPPPPWTYVAQHPYRCLSMLLSSAIAIFLFHELHQLTVGTAILTGYACQDISERLRASAASKISVL